MVEVHLAHHGEVHRRPELCPRPAARLTTERVRSGRWAESDSMARSQRPVLLRDEGVRLQQGDPALVGCSSASSSRSSRSPLEPAFPERDAAGLLEVDRRLPLRRRRRCDAPGSHAAAGLFRPCSASYTFAHRFPFPLRYRKSPRSPRRRRAVRPQPPTIPGPVRPRLKLEILSDLSHLRPPDHGEFTWKPSSRRRRRRC